MLGKIKYVLKKNLNMKTSYVVGLTIFSLFLVVGGISVAFYNSQAESRGSLNIVTENLSSVIESNDLDENHSIKLNGQESKLITVTLKNINSIDAKFDFYYGIEEGIVISYDSKKDTPPLKDGYVIEKGKDKTYTIKITNIKEEEKTITFGSKVGLASKDLAFPEGKAVIEKEIPSEPELGEEMIPVIIEDDGRVFYANTNNSWYDYDLKKWANAVILVDNAKEKYQVGSKIEEEDIESYFVWIPRYKYQLFDLGNYEEYEGTEKVTGNAKTINIEFQTKDDPKEETEEVGKYYTHPAFTLGGKELSGLWVGKFEVGYNQTGDGKLPINTEGWTEPKAQVDEINERKIIVKPNVYSWRFLTVYKTFMNAYQYKRKLDSHMMKNIEWGAVAYLSHSEYGINKEVNVNNNSIHLTGYSAAEGTNQDIFRGQTGTSEDVTQPYNTETGYKASTTGNITGVYDMSGGAYEYMAAYMDGYGVKSSQGVASGFSDEDLILYQVYLDKYGKDSDTTVYKNRILGDATGEMGPFYYYQDEDGLARFHNAWYSDISHIMFSTVPWLSRGGFYFDGVLAGQFAFHRYPGATHSSVTSRLVLAP